MTMIAKNNLIFVIEQTIKKRTKQYLVKEIIVTFITTALTEWISRFFRYYSIFLREFERIPRKRGEAKLLVAPTNESLNNSVYRNIADNVFFLSNNRERLFDTSGGIQPVRIGP